MGILRDFEQRLEGAVEGFFAKLFRSGLQPVELAKALQRYAGNYQQVGVAGVLVPNVYRFDLSQDDYERFSGFETSLRRELSDVVRRTARDRGWQLQGPVRVELRSSEDVSVGTYELRGKVKTEEREPGRSAAPERAVSDYEQPRRQREAGRGAPTDLDDFSGQAVERTTVMGTANATPALHLLNGSEPGRRVELRGRMLLGRLPECDLRIDDVSVSRRHARVTQRAGGWSIEDLDSTNGVRVNGTNVRQTTLQHGDTIELGSIKMTFALEG
jgi:hypothetical protein